MSDVIFGLVFENNEYPTDILLYWQDEQSGKLGEALMKIINCQEIDQNQADLARKYFAHWVNFEGFKIAPEIKASLNTAIATAQTSQDFVQCWHQLVEEGIDPL